ncbi:hypothetical protein O1611_g3049 [Lasiodiplodia mahajangana]|uniref:Uncharacterized protein n=1 Tax=Lasiodiplodia mahajangana TaxID=1108764 RepID=A0ACC2JSV4_9PEZI|nr:hypothetical protein O1611_g3049 [Lasiodiplodia mahajangana]
MYSTSNTGANGAHYYTYEPFHGQQMEYIPTNDNITYENYNMSAAQSDYKQADNISGSPFTFIGNAPEEYIGGQHPPLDPQYTTIYSPDQGPRPKQSRSHFTLGGWSWEFASAVVSIASAAAIVVVLSVENGRALSGWHFPIAPNSLVSIFSTIAKSTLLVSVASCLSQLKWIYFAQSSRPLHHFELFEEASRGPCGAAVLSWAVHIRAKLALFGSIITILALAMEPFTQQILAFPSRIVPSNQLASFGFGMEYDSGIGLSKTTTVFGLPIESKIQGAIMSGLYDSEAPVTVECPTGQCTWPPFTTLALSAQCSNVTQETTTNCTFNGPSEECIYITPGGFHISTTASFSQGGASYTLFNSSATSQWDRSSAWANSTLLKLAAVNISSTISATGGTNAEYESPYAIECNMSWVARTFQGISVVDGTFMAGTTEDHELKGIQTTSDSEWWYPGPYQFRIKNASNDTLKYLVFTINPNDHGIIAGHLQEVFSSNSDDNFGMALMQSSDMIGTIQNISTRVTYAIGQGRNATSAPGTALTGETYIRVQWPWFILPALAIFGSLVLLIATVIYSASRGVASWKRSSLLPLFTRFTGLYTGDIAPHSPQNMMSRAQGIRVRFDMKDEPILNVT